MNINQLKDWADAAGNLCLNDTGFRLIAPLTLGNDTCVVGACGNAYLALRRTSWPEQRPVNANHVRALRDWLLERVECWTVRRDRVLTWALDASPDETGPSSLFGGKAVDRLLLAHVLRAFDTPTVLVGWNAARLLHVLSPNVRAGLMGMSAASDERAAERGVYEFDGASRVSR